MCKVHNVGLRYIKKLVAVKGPQVAVFFARSGSEGFYGPGNIGRQVQKGPYKDQKKGGKGGRSGHRGRKKRW